MVGPEKNVNRQEQNRADVGNGGDTAGQAGQGANEHGGGDAQDHQEKPVEENRPRVAEDEGDVLAQSGHGTAPLPVHDGRHELRQDKNREAIKQEKKDQQPGRNPDQGIVLHETDEQENHRPEKHQGGHEAHPDQTEEKEEEAVPLRFELAPRLLDGAAIFHHTIDENELPARAQPPECHEDGEDDQADDESHQEPGQPFLHVGQGKILGARPDLRVIEVGNA